MNEREFNDVLCEMILASDPYESGATVVTVRTYEEAGVLAGNEGLVVRLEDGSEFQVTTVQSS